MRHQVLARNVVVAVALVAAVAGCSDDAEPAGSSPTTSAAAATSSAAPTASASGSAGPSASGPVSGTGCDPNQQKVPANANVAKTGDLDLDGAADELWMADSDGDRFVGVRTATGTVFSTTFTSAAPQAAAALGQRLGDDTAVVLLDTGRAVQLWTVVNCELVPSKNPQGEQYTFDKGFTGYGTGVGCTDLGDGLQLVGLLAKSGKGGWEVSQTAIQLSDFGRKARNGKTTKTISNGAANDPRVKAAQSVTCGDQTKPVTEPQT